MNIIKLGTFFFLVVVFCQAKKDLNFVKLGNCVHSQNLTILWQNIILTRNSQGKCIAMQLDILIKKIAVDLWLSVTFWKCDKSGNLDSCEYFMRDYKVHKICDLLSRKGELWSVAIDNMNIPRKCPVPVGKYYLNKTEVDVDSNFKYLPIPSAYWRVNVKAYDKGYNNLFVSCLDLEFEIYNARRSG